MRVLLVDDDELLVQMLAKVFRADGLAVDVATTCEQGEFLVSLGSYDLIVLDWNLPDRPGIQICQTVRRLHRPDPILLLTQRASVDDCIAGLDYGADDYLPKPFQLGELKARMRALFRRQPNLVDSIIQIGPFVLNRARREVERAGSLYPSRKRNMRFLSIWPCTGAV